MFHDVSLVLDSGFGQAALPRFMSGINKDTQGQLLQRQSVITGKANPYAHPVIKTITDACLDPFSGCNKGNFLLLPPPPSRVH